MKAYEKFEKRLQELGLLDEWRNVGERGRVATETEDNIFVLVHEADDDAYSEFTFPPMRVMAEHDYFRDRALAEFVDAGDEKFIRELVWWWINPKFKCPLFPVDVYHLWHECSCMDFEDDEEDEVEEEMEYLNQYCNHCDSMVHVDEVLMVQKCPECGKWIIPCSVCPMEKCSKHCPLERQANILNERDARGR
jgi:predicted RNA-binding Zn-ribbon protein involved in translation (DUF1610 family)